jgi:hypothetical protein
LPSELQRHPRRLNGDCRLLVRRFGTAELLLLLVVVVVVVVMVMVWFVLFVLIVKVADY